MIHPVFVGRGTLLFREIDKTPPGQQHTFQMAAGRAPEPHAAIRRMAAWGHTSRAAWVAEPPI